MKPSKIFAAGLIFILFVVHQDFWNWGVTERTVGGLPQGFVFQVGLSIAAALMWWIVTMIAWPKDEWSETQKRHRKPLYRKSSQNTHQEPGRPSMMGLNDGQTKLVILTGYMLLLVLLGIGANKLLRGTKKDYLLASHTIGPVLLLLSMFGTTMTAFAIVGSSSKAFELGTGVYGMLASASGIVHSLCFYMIGLKLYRHGRKYGYSTQIEFFRDRVESGFVGLLMFPILVGLIIPYLMIGVIGGGLVISAATVDAFPGWGANGSVPIWAGALVICLVVLSYVFLGGMRGTTWANAFQTIVFMTLGGLAFYLLSAKLGGQDSFWENFTLLNSKIPDDAVARKKIPQSIYFCFMFIPLSVAMFPHLFQHWLTAKSSNTFKLPVVLHPIFIMIVWVPCVLIGCWAMNELTLSEAIAGKTFLRSSNDVMPVMVNQFIGPVTGGFLSAGILAAIMSSLDSQFLCIGSMFTNDLVGTLRKEKLSDRTEIWLARGFVIGIVAVTYFACLATGFGASVFGMAIWCFSGFAGLFPIIVAALYWKRLSAAGVVSGLLAGIGSWLYLFQESDWGSNPTFAVVIRGIPIMPVVVVFVCTSIAMVMTTMVTRPPSQATLDKFFD